MHKSNWKKIFESYFVMIEPVLIKNRCWSKGIEVFPVIQFSKVSPKDGKNIFKTFCQMQAEVQIIWETAEKK